MEEVHMRYDTFPEMKEDRKTLDKILKIIIIGLLVMIVILLIDAVGTLAQIYEKEYQAWPDSWILKPIGEWYEVKKAEVQASLQK